MGAADPKRYFPVFLDLEGRLVVIIGCGKAAEKRARQFTRYGADVTVICPRPSELLLAGQSDGALSIEQRPYVRGDLAGASLVICVEDDADVQRAVFEEAESVGCLVNVSDAPQYANFLIPGVVRHGRLEVAISTGGAAPEAAKALRHHLDESIGAEWSAWMDLIAEARIRAATLSDDPSAQAALLAAATDRAVRARLAAGEAVTAEKLLTEALEAGSDVAESEEA